MEFFDSMAFCIHFFDFLSAFVSMYNKNRQKQLSS